ncbi:unnamed protein product [Adineta steineri]|uniref:Uncharacterized protein n=1 Tax=Adineta steineri TaxID=433720 RepID=A0A814JX92_9BILA|nr:unnamed protein product [Adineta steineri]CAF1318771.1 unnamed protein product [Adineta steineri]
MTGTSGQVPGCTCHNYDDRPVSFTYNFSPDYSHHGNCPGPDDFLPGDYRCYDDFPSAPDHRDCWNFCCKDNMSNTFSNLQILILTSWKRGTLLLIHDKIQELLNSVTISTEDFL